jgi:VanZ family protein
MILSSWLPPLLWMALIFALSSDAGSGQHTRSVLGPLLAALLPWATDLQIEAVHFLLRKTAHAVVYAVLALLWFRALRIGVRSRWSAAGLAFAVALAWAGLDEARQALVPSRTGAVGDVLIDGTGAGLAALASGMGYRIALWRAARLLLLIAALVGSLVLVVDRLVGAPSGVLWIAVPAAAVALAGLRWWWAGHPRTGESASDAPTE